MTEEQIREAKSRAIALLQESLDTGQPIIGLFGTSMEGEGSTLVEFLKCMYTGQYQVAPKPKPTLRTVAPNVQGWPGGPLPKGEYWIAGDASGRWFAYQNQPEKNTLFQHWGAPGPCVPIDMEPAGDWETSIEWVRVL